MKLEAQAYNPHGVWLRERGSEQERLTRALSRSRPGKEGNRSKHFRENGRSSKNPQ